MDPNPVCLCVCPYKNGNLDTETDMYMYREDNVKTERIPSTNKGTTEAPRS